MIIIIIRQYHNSCHWSIPYQQVVTHHLSVAGFFGEFLRTPTVLISVMFGCLVQCAVPSNTSVVYSRKYQECQL